MNQVPLEKTNQIAVSVVVITLNEEHSIGRLIDSVSWADEVFIYDSGSTDLTVQIAQNKGAKVVVGPWLGFGPTKKKASLLAAHDWILSLDADEEVPLLLAEEIHQKWPARRPETAYQFPRLSRYLGKWIRHGGWYPDLQVRFFNRQHSQWDDAAIHEKVVAREVERFRNHFYHYVFKNIEHQVQTNNRYSSLQAQEMFQRGKKFSWFHFLTKPTVKFLECYVLKRGFLDGWVGFVIARNAAYSVFLKWSKLKELNPGNLK